MNFRKINICRKKAAIIKAQDFGLGIIGVREDLSKKNSSYSSF